MENIEHHTEEEEEEKMFPKVRQLVNKAELEQLGSGARSSEASKALKTSRSVLNQPSVAFQSRSVDRTFLRRVQGI
jgi:hypothetical protein